MDKYKNNDCVLQVRSLIDSLPDIREEMVRNLRIQIQNNLYRPDPDEIADRMLEESLQETYCLAKS